MKIKGTCVNFTFGIEYKGKVYTVDFLNSDYQILDLANRNYFEIWDENGEEADLSEEEKKDILEFIANSFYGNEVKELIQEGLKAHKLEF
jgi:trimethylamine:corrinoid methyltransferase-like protein